MRVTIDTNVIVQGLYSKRGASHAILQLVLQHEIILALSTAVFLEYEDVLGRDETAARLGIPIMDVDTVLDALAYLGESFERYYRWRPNLRDEKDNIFMELAVTSQSRYLITYNIKDFTIDNELRFDDVTIITPPNFMKMWRKQNE